MADLDQLIQLEETLFKVPWKKVDYQRELEENKFAHYYVVEENEELVAYCGFWCLYDQAQITTIGTKRDYQGQGFASQLLKKVEEISKEEGCEICSLEVRRSNEKAQNLYKKFGYSQVAIRKSYYSDNHEDAFLMMKAIGGNNESNNFSD